MTAFSRADEDIASIERERAPLLSPSAERGLPPIVAKLQVPDRLARRLYVSHFLSTWNSRVFEFGAVLYLATIYPGTLLPMSLYAFVRGLSATILAPAVGHYIDTGNRLQVVRVSIVFQRLAVTASCVIFYILTVEPSLGDCAKGAMLAVLSILACAEKLTSIMNLVSIEKDWVVVIAREDHASLRTLNAQMRRIDLLCKLLGPLFIALVDDISAELAITANFAMNITSVIVEYVAIARVYQDVPDLQQPKRHPHEEHVYGLSGTALPDSEGWILHHWRRVQSVAAKSARDFDLYFHHRAFLPSFAGALLYLTVLNFAGQMVTYLLSIGYSSTHISLARTMSVIFEVLATWAGPWLMGWIGPVRAGLWLSSWQVMMLMAGVVVFWTFLDRDPVISAGGLVIGTTLSRVGLRGFDLCAQFIIQEEVEAENRGSFSAVEAAWQNAFELISYASTIIFFRNEQFKWPTMLSLTAVVLASSIYTFFVYLRRGHLLHLELLLPLIVTGKEIYACGILGRNLKHQMFSIFYDHVYFL